MFLLTMVKTGNKVTISGAQDVVLPYSLIFAQLVLIR